MAHHLVHCLVHCLVHQRKNARMLCYIQSKNGWHYYRRKVPTYIRHLDSRKEVKISLKTKDNGEAIRRAQIYNDQIENFWKALVKSGSAEGSRQKYIAAVQLAKSYGFAYKTPYELAASPLEEIMERLSHEARTEGQTEALLGGADKPKVRLSDCNSQYWDLTIDRTIGKSAHSIRKWKNPRKAALKNFILVLGDKPLDEISRSDILAFKSWWRERLTIGRSPSTANKQIQQVKDIIRTVALQNEIDIDTDALFAKTSFQYTVNSRPPFESSFVQDILLPGLTDLNERDRMALWVMADTGMRETEVFGAIKKDIRLDSDIPFVWIQPREGYTLKTPTSERQIPLVGCALEAFRKFPEGFHHKGNPDTFSSIANSYLTDRKLRPTPRHSAYSLRHTFKDRLRDIEAPEEIIDDLMGHKKSGPKYGRGHKLDKKYKWLRKIAYVPPKNNAEKC